MSFSTRKPLSHFWKYLTSPSGPPVTTYWSTMLAWGRSGMPFASSFCFSRYSADRNFMTGLLSLGDRTQRRRPTLLHSDDLRRLPGPFLGGRRRPPGVDQEQHDRGQYQYDASEQGDRGCRRSRRRRYEWLRRRRL